MPHLKTAAQFAAVLNGSKDKTEPAAGVWRSSHFVLHVAPYSCIWNEQQKQAALAITPIVGVICPKRWAKRAVTRNTIKRQIYAVSSELQATLPATCLVLRLANTFSREQYPSATSPALKTAIRRELLGLFNKLPQQTITS